MLKGKVANVTEAEANQPALRGSVRCTVSFSESGSAESDKTESAVTGSDLACSSKSAMRCFVPHAKVSPMPTTVRANLATSDF